MICNLKTIKQTAQLLNCAEITLRRLIVAGKISYHKVGRRYLFTEEDLCEYLNLVRVEAKKTVGGINL